MYVFVCSGERGEVRRAQNHSMKFFFSRSSQEGSVVSHRHEWWTVCMFV